MVNVVNIVSEYFPTRTQVKWKLSESGIVVIYIEKEFGKLEQIIANFFSAPSNVRRPLDDMNSELWLLMDGTNTLAEIIIKMDQLFDERISPVSERVTKSIAEFVDLGLAVIVRDPDTIDWIVHPSVE